MKLLLLGGTMFLGRHLAEAALRAGHEVTLFHRGQTGADLFPEAEHILGDRMGPLDALAGRSWDAVVDTSAYFPDMDASIEEAQAYKKRHIAAKLLLKLGQRVLDIGSGWDGGGTPLVIGGTAARIYL